MTKAGKILNSTGATVVQLQKEIGADSETIYIACTGHGKSGTRNHSAPKLLASGFRDRKLAVHSSNVRYTHIVDARHVEQQEEKEGETPGSTPRGNIKSDPCECVNVLLDCARQSNNRSLHEGSLVIYHCYVVLLDGPAPLHLAYVGGNYAPSCCNCCAGTKRKKVRVLVSSV